MNLLSETAHWRAFPSAARVKVWVDHRDTLGRALTLYRPNSRPGKVIKALAPWCPRLFSPLVCRGQPDARTRARLELVATTVRETLGEHVSAISVSPGAVGNHQKMTAQVSGRAGVIAYVKATDEPAVAHLLANEAAMLNWLADKDLGTAVVPKLIRFDETAGCTFLLQSPPPVTAQPRGDAAVANDAAFLSALSQTGRKQMLLTRLLDNWRAAENVGHRSSAAQALDALHHDVEIALAAILPSNQIAVSASHGDYAPWNCLQLSDGRHFVYDWEYGGKEAPLLADLFHLVYMPARHKMSPARLIRRLLSVHADPVLGDAVTRSGIYRAELPGYLLLFLLQLAHRSHAAQGAVSPIIAACLRACLDVVNGATPPESAVEPKGEG